MARRAPADAVIVVLLPDTGERYLSKVHSDEWMKENRLLEGFDPTVGEVLQRRPSGLPRLVSVDAQSLVREAIAPDPAVRRVATAGAARRRAASGVVNEAKILRAALEDAAVLSQAGRPTVMDAPLPEISARETAERPSSSWRNATAARCWCATAISSSAS